MAKNNADNLLVARFLGSSALGAYAVSYNLMFIPMARVIVPVQETLFPAFSRWQDDPAGSVWLRVLRLVAAVLAPVMLGLLVVAPDFVTVILGHKWQSAAPVLQLLSVVSLAQCLAMLGIRALSAVDKTRVLFRFSILDAVTTILAFAVGIHWGIVGVALCYLIVSVPLQVLYVALTADAVGVSAVQIMRALSGVALAAGVMVAGCFVTRLALISAHVGPAARLGIVVAVGVAIYASASGVLQREVIDEIRNIRARRGGNELAVAT